MSRFPPIPPFEQTSEQRRAHDEIEIATSQAFNSKAPFILKNEQGAFVGPFAQLLYAPNLCTSWLDLSHKNLMQPTLTFLERELVILAVLSHTQPAYALYAHARIAEKAGLSVSQISDAKTGKLPDGLTKRERATYAFARALAALRGPLPGGEFEGAEAVLGKDGTAAVMHLVGQFLYSSLLLNAADVPIPEETC